MQWMTRRGRVSYLTTEDLLHGTVHAAGEHDLHANSGAEHAVDQMTGTGDHSDHDRHEGHSVAMFRDKFWLSLLMTIPVLIWSPDFEAWFGYTAPAFPGSAYIPALFGSVIFFYGGAVFLRGARGELNSRQPGMMTLISMAIVVAFGVSWLGQAGLFEIETLVGTVQPDRHHAAGPLDGDALHRPGPGRPEGPR